MTIECSQSVHSIVILLLYSAAVGCFSESVIRISPTAKRRIRDSTPYLELWKKYAQKEMISGPKKSANLPNTSKKPKYSLDSSFGMIFP